MSDLTGGCACGRIRYTPSDKAIFQVHCHCLDCQKASGRALGAVLIVAADVFTSRAWHADAASGDVPRFELVPPPDLVGPAVQKYFARRT